MKTQQQQHHRENKYTFVNGATVIAPTIEIALEAIKKEYGVYLRPIKHEEVKSSR